MAHAAAEIPLGLTQLLPLGQVSVRQKGTFSSGNKYQVSSGLNPLMYAKEQGPTGGGKHRTFVIDVFDTQHKEVFRVRRPTTWWTDRVEVTVGGRLACVVRHKNTFLKSVLFINDDQDRPVLKVKGPAWTSGECDFNISTLTGDMQKIGVIHKKWDGFLREAFTNTDNFQIKFPADLDVAYKCAIIGTCFFIDFLYYEP